MGLNNLLSHDIAVDLGTANTLISLSEKGLVINEPSVVAINKKTKDIIAIGEPAKAMLGKTPDEIQAARPLIDGVVSDYEITEQMLKSFIDKIHRVHKVLWPRPRMIIGLPSGVTEVEHRAVEEAAKSSGARRVYLIEEPVAASIGAGLDVLGAGGVMVVDVGGGTTEVAVIALGSVVVFKSLRVAGDEFTEAIINFIREEFGLQIGEQTAERIKTEIGAVYAHSDPKKTTVRGRNVLTGLPQEAEVSSDILRTPLARQAKPIIDAIKATLEEAPPELVADVMIKGIVLTGGGSLIRGIDHLVQGETNIETIVAPNALTAVVEGASTTLQDLDKYRNVLISESKK